MKQLLPRKLIFNWTSALCSMETNVFTAPSVFSFRLKQTAPRCTSHDTMSGIRHDALLTVHQRVPSEEHGEVLNWSVFCLKMFWTRYWSVLSYWQKTSEREETITSREISPLLLELFLVVKSLSLCMDWGLKSKSRIRGDVWIIKIHKHESP